MDLLTSLALFRRTVEAGSFSAVAREGHLAQSTVSKHIAALEQHLGVKLFHRNTRQLTLTESGQDFYGHCTRILDALDEAESSVRRDDTQLRGTLRISATATFGRLFILPFLWDFLAEHPQLNIDMILEDRYVDLVKEGVDMAVRVGPLADSSMVARPLGTSERVVVASPDYLRRRGEPKTLQDLATHDCLSYSLQADPLTWEFRTGRGTESIRIHSRFGATSPGAIIDAALAGFGIAVVMLWSVRDHIRENRLQVILPDYRPTPYEVNAVYPDRKLVPGRVRKLIDHLQNSYTTHYPQIASMAPRPSAE